MSPAGGAASTAAAAVPAECLDTKDQKQLLILPTTTASVTELAPSSAAVMSLSAQRWPGPPDLIR